MKYTPAQYRDALGISQETLRHWRKVLPIFQNRAGYAPVFSISDLIIGAIIKHLKEKLGINVAHFAPFSMALAETLNGTSWARMQKSSLALNIDERSCVLLSDTSSTTCDTLQIYVPLKPLLAELSAALTKPDDSLQQQIYFPPTSISPSKARQRRKS